MFISLTGIKFWLIVVFTVGLTCIVSPSLAQTSNPSPNKPPASTPGGGNTITNFFPSLSDLSNFTTMPTTAWIWLDDRSLFQVSALENYLPERVQIIETNLRKISNAYFQNNTDNLLVKVVNVNASPTININGQYLLTVTNLDAQLRGIDTTTWAKQLSEILQQALVLAKQERQPPYLIRQGEVTCGIFGLVAIGNWMLIKLRRRIRSVKSNSDVKSKVATDDILQSPSLESKASERLYKRNFQAIERRLLVYIQFLLWVGGILISLYLFPYTRSLQVWLLKGLEIPLKLGLVILGVYFAIRLSHAFIDRFVSTVNTNPFLSPIANER